MKVIVLPVYEALKALVLGSFPNKINEIAIQAPMKVQSLSRRRGVKLRKGLVTHTDTLLLIGLPL